MAFIDPFGTTCSNKNIFVVVGHSHHFVGDHLPDGQNQVEAAFDEQAVYLCRPRVVNGALRNFLDKFRRNSSQGNHIFSPVVFAEKVARCLSEHVADLFVGHGGVRTQCRQNIGEFVSVILPGHFGQFARPRR